MSEIGKASDQIADKIAKLDEQIALAKNEAIDASRLIAQMRLAAGKKKVKELQALKSALEEIQKETLKEEAAL
ncbi:MAG TPA: hypothetical protein PL044_11375 [Clostridiales bacterium]|nr:hypothetical protein [Clostridiales bacterium]HQH63807.1 hypothetical protein [Clostridiales bacterium]HQK74357.1 hypothetical protein [Clostridiales bacterium]